MRCTDGRLRTHTMRRIGNLRIRMQELGVNPFMATWVLHKILGRTNIGKGNTTRTLTESTDGV